LELRVIDTTTKEIIGDTLLDIKFSGISWKGNEGFYYSSYDKPKGSELSAKTDQHKVYYHTLGTAQDQDVLIYGGTTVQKHRYVGATVTEDTKYLLISAAKSTSGNKLFIQDLEAENAPLIPILNHTNSDSYVIENVGSKLFIVTNLNAPNKKIITVDAADPTPKNWVDFIPETENVLSANTGGGYFFAQYMVDAISKVLQYDYTGNLIREVSLPGLGSASGFGGKKEDTECYFSFSNYYTPSSSYKYQVEHGTYTLYWKPEIDFNSDKYVSKQVFYTSKDGAKIPMIITHKKGSSYLAIRGGSNGGLLVGATMNQRPDLMQVALPAVGVLDMLRYHTFTAGAGWAYDYGTVEDSKEMMEYLKAYSPVHNVKNNVSYPATLVTTGDHDDRVVPAHSFKFAATLQAKQTGKNPTLIRIETNAGHGAGTPVDKIMEEYADLFGFTLYNMGFKQLPNSIKY